MPQGFDSIERDYHGECHRERGAERPVVLSTLCQVLLLCLCDYVFAT
jgi:hypothetical protein